MNSSVLDIKLQVILKVIARVGRIAILQDFRKDSCIASTRVMTRVLDHYGFHAEPKHVKVIIFNKVMLEYWNKGQVPNRETQEFRDFCDSTGAWSVGLGYEQPGQKPVGHVVAVLPEEMIMIDASLDQANRPHKSIELPCPFITGIGSQFLAGESVSEYQCPEGVVRYIPDFENQTYKESLDWLVLQRTDRAVSRIVEFIGRLSALTPT